MHLVNSHRFGSGTRIPLENIISEWKFEDNVLDSVGANDGTATGVTYSTDMVGKAGNFGASATSYVTVLDADNLSFTNGVNDLPFSISFLIEFSSYDSTNGLWVINKRENTSTLNEWQLRIRGDNISVNLINYDGSAIIRNKKTFTPTLNNTYHCVVTYDGSETALGLNLYIDAVSGGTQDEQGTYTGMTNTTSRVDIGRRGFSTVGTSIYKLDCLRIWDKELSSDEVLEIATQELAGVDINPHEPDTSFQMEFTTTLPSETVYLPIQSIDGSGILVFDDGTPNVVGSASNASHTFANAGTYVIKYYGTATSLAWATATTPQKQYLTKILDWGITGATSASFRYCSSLLSVAGNLESTVTGLYYCFANQTGNPDVSLLDISNVTNMYYLFGQSPNATPDTSGWNTSSATSMSNMFYRATSANPDTSGWNTSNVIYMNNMFAYASNATPDTSGWDTSNVTNMSSMFDNATSANPDVSLWNTSSVTNMSFMFSNRSSGTTPDTTDWNTSSVTDMSYMFFNTAMVNPDVSKWDTSSVLNMSRLFSLATSANPDVSLWNTSSVTNMSSVFNYATSANPDVSLWDFDLVTNYSDFFTSSDISTANYDKFLIRLNDERITHSLTGRSIGDIPSTYTTATSGAARTALLANGWTFTDDGGI